MLTIRAVDSQEREQVAGPASQIHNHLVQMLRRRDTQSLEIKRRSRCGSVRGCPVLSSHFSPGPAPQVGQRTACTCLRVGFLAFMVFQDAAIRRRKMVNFAQVKLGQLLKYLISSTINFHLRNGHSGNL